MTKFMVLGEITATYYSNFFSYRYCLYTKFYFFYEGGRIAAHCIEKKGSLVRQRFFITRCTIFIYYYYGKVFILYET